MGYSLGAWGTNGQPTVALDAFRNAPPSDGLVFNPGFEYTAATQTPLGWTTDAGPGSTDADFTQNYGYSSLFQLTHQKAAAYQVRTYQLLAAVPTGTYTLRAWVQSSGGQSLCQLYASGFGGPEQSTVIGATNGGWVRVEVPNVAVTSGRCEIGLRSDGHAGEFCGLDDVEFGPSQPTATRKQTSANQLEAQLFPNPAGSQCTVRYTLARAETVQLSLVSLTGQPVLTLPARPQAAGTHAEAIQLGSALAPGVYLPRIRHGDQQAVRKLIKY